MTNVYIIHNSPALYDSSTCGSSSWKENEILIRADGFFPKNYISHCSAATSTSSAVCCKKQQQVFCWLEVLNKI